MPPSPARRVGTLPAELTTFIGRRQELSAIKQLLSESRLVTLTGVGGAGKTRLSLRLAADLQRAFTDGVTFVELAALKDPELLPQSVATALGVHDRTAKWQAADLADYLRDSNALLVLDNCEHLRDECAVLVNALLTSAPNLRVLATSRQALTLTGEYIFHVPTLSVPSTASSPDVEELRQYEAVGLFVDRAAAVQPTFVLTKENCETVARICQRLDGIPLALELTAVRLRSLCVDEILERLDDRFRLLTGGSPGARPEHKTLRALFDWSSDLCSAEEQSLWARLSVFPGSFTLDAAEATCADDSIEGSVLDVLAALVDKSIVVAETENGRVRYRLLETIRQYGVEHLADQDLEVSLRQRHLDFFAGLVDEACAQWRGPDQERWLARLQHEHDNVRSALEFSLDDPPLVETGLRIAGALWFFWIATGRTSEGRHWLERGLGLDSRPSTTRARALWVYGYLCTIQEDIDSARPATDECHAHAELLEDPDAAAWATQLSGMLAMSEGQLDRARVLLEDGLRKHRARNDPVGVLDDCFYLIAVTALLRDLHQAAAYSEEALAVCDAHGERWLRSYLLWDLGLVAWQLGDSKRAAASGRDALRIARSFNEQWAIAFCIEILAWCAHADTDHRRAARLLGAADGFWRRIGAPLFGMQHLSTYHTSCVTRVRDALGSSEFAAEFEDGVRLDGEKAVCYALGEREPDHATAPRVEPAAGLTPREREVADLVAQGMSNKAIAAKLVIAPRTAEAHVEHILTKLGFTSRTQVAAWVAAHGADPDQTSVTAREA